MIVTQEAKDRNDEMAAIEIEFEHAVRFLVRVLREFRRKPGEREKQLELFRALQGAYLQYSRIGRNYGAQYGDTIETLTSAAQETRSLLTSLKAPPNVLRGIRKELSGIQKTSSLIKVKPHGAHRAEAAPR